MMEEELLVGVLDPVIRTAGITAMGAAGAVGGYLKLRQSISGKSPTETAISNLLPQAFSRAAIAVHDMNRLIQAQLIESSGIDGLKASLRTAASREEKVSLWTEVVVQSYALMLVAPHVISTLIVAVALRSAVGVLAHLQQSAGMQLDASGDNLLSSPSARRSILRTFISSVFSGGAKTAITDAVMSHLSSLLGSNAFGVDDADSNNASSLGNAVSPLTFGNAELVEVLCDKIPSLIQRARLCVMEQVGMIAEDALPAIRQATGRGEYSQHCGGGGKGGVDGPAAAASLVDVTLKASLADVEGALWRAHYVFSEYVLDWQGDVFGSSPILFRELADDVGANGASDSVAPTCTGSEGIVCTREEGAAAEEEEEEEDEFMKAMKGFSFQSSADPAVADAYRRITRRYMQDLLTCEDVKVMLRALGEENFRYWWDVTFYHRGGLELAGGGAAPSSPTALASSPSASPAACSPTVQRAMAACKSYDVSTGSVRLLEFALSVDKSRQALLMNPFFADVVDGRPYCLSIPQSVKTFCEEMIRASGPK